MIRPSGGKRPPRRVDADQASVAENERAAGVAGIDRRVRLHHVRVVGHVERALAVAAADDRDDTRRRGQIGLPRRVVREADGDHALTEAQARLVPERQRLEARSVRDLQNDQILARSGSENRRVPALAVDGDRERAAAVDHVRVVTIDPLRASSRQAVPWDSCSPASNACSARRGARSPSQLERSPSSPDGLEVASSRRRRLAPQLGDSTVEFFGTPR